MRAVTLIIDGLDYSSHARQVSLLAPAMMSLGWDVKLLSFGGDGPLGAAVRHAGIPVLGRSGRRTLDLDDFQTIRQLIRANRQYVLHVFGLSAFRSLSLHTVGLGRQRLLLNLNGRERLNPLDRWLVRRCHAITVPHSAAADAIVRQGISRARVNVVPLVVGEPPSTPHPDETRRSLGLPLNVPLVATACHMGRRSDLFQALWLFEYVHYLRTGVQLFVVGDGPSRMELEHAVQGLGIEGTNITFLGARPDVPALMELADVALVVKPKGGMNVVLEAMAAGLAVVASDTPDLRSIIQSNDTGVLFPAIETREGSRAVRNLLLDVAELRRVGQAARNWVRERHSIAGVLSAYELLYEQ